MTPSRLQKVEEIFHSALNRAPAERESFLAAACGADDELRREVDSLLSFEKNTESFVQVSPAEIAAEMLDERETSDFSGKKINQYKILSLLGMGGMGAVYLARDTTLERKVAVKLLTGDFAGDATRLNRFFQEAKSASALNHPNILTVHEIGVFEGANYIVTEFIDGRTLNDYLKEEKPPPEKILEVAAQIASALSSAHEAGIVHRDIKPDNIMMRRDGIIKILDFGIAKLTDTTHSGETDIDLEAATQARPMTVPGMIIGTPQYMSPEQARGQKVDSRSDIFSFGVLLYEMLAGHPPFTGTTNMDVIGSILKDEPPPLSGLLPEIPLELERIVNKSLRKDRELRYQYIKDLLIDLNDARHTLEFDAKFLHHTDPAKRRTTAETNAGIPSPRLSPLVYLGVMVLIAGLTAGAYFWFFPNLQAGEVSRETPLKTSEIITWTSTPGEFYSTGSFSPDGKMIAFASTKAGGKHLWIKQTGAGEAVQITKDEFTNEQPVWSPSGEELAFFSTRGNQTGVWRIPILGGSPKFIATVEDGSALLRRWTKNGLIYYESGSELFAIDVNSGQPRQITDLIPALIRADSINISPDEQKISFITVDEEKWSVWWKQIAGGEPRKLFTSDTEIKNTAWHTDNRRFFFSRLMDGSFQVFVTDPDAVQPNQISFGERDAFVLDVSADGKNVLYGSAKEESDIWRVVLKDAKETAIASDIGSELWASPAPDGRSIAFQSIKNLSQGNNLFNGKIFIKKLNSDEQPVETAPAGYLPAWSPDGAVLAFMEVSGNKNRLATIRVGGGQKQLAADNVAAINNTLLPYNRLQTSSFSWSPDSRKIAYVSRDGGHHNIWLTGAGGADRSPLTANEDEKLYFYCPLWSPDGKLIAFTSRTGNRAGKPTFGVWVIDAETRAARLLTQQKIFFRLIGWEPNGGKLLLVSTDASETSIVHEKVSILQLEVESGSLRTVAALEDVYLANIQLAPDGKTIAFAAHREGFDNIWLVSLSGGEARKLTNNNDSRLYFSSLAWSPDGGAIFYGKQSRYSLLSMLTNFK